MPRRRSLGEADDFELRIEIAAFEWAMQSLIFTCFTISAGGMAALLHLAGFYEWLSRIAFGA